MTTLHAKLCGYSLSRHLFGTKHLKPIGIIQSAVTWDPQETYDKIMYHISLIISYNMGIEVVQCIMFNRDWWWLSVGTNTGNTNEHTIALLRTAWGYYAITTATYKEWKHVVTNHFLDSEWEPKDETACHIKNIFRGMWVIQETNFFYLTKKHIARHIWSYKKRTTKDVEVLYHALIWCSLRVMPEL